MPEWIEKALVALKEKREADDREEDPLRGPAEARSELRGKKKDGHRRNHHVSSLYFLFLLLAPIAIISVGLYMQHTNELLQAPHFHPNPKKAMLTAFLSAPRSSEVVPQESSENVARADIQATAEVPPQEKPAAPTAPASSAGSGPSTVKNESECTEFAYWENAPGVGPFRSLWQRSQNADNKSYISFEPDKGGWNNIRMAMETVAALAFATGRTLVMPPEEPMYLISKKGKYHGFADFFPLDELARPQNESQPQLEPGLNIINTHTFLLREFQEGKRLPPQLLRRGDAGRGMTVVSQEELDTSKDIRKAAFTYLRDPHVAMQPVWKPNDHGLVIPSGPHRTLADDLKSADIEQSVIRFKAKRKSLVEFNEHHRDARVIHLASDFKTHRRLLTHFYLFLKLTDSLAEASMMRFIRKHFHYRKELYCAAAKGVLQLRRESGDKGYSSLHIRRGDFQYKQVKLRAADILNNSQDVLLPREMLYISTDEKDRSFFAPFERAGYTLRFIKDIAESVGLNRGILADDPNFIGMVEQIVASKGRVFVGTWYSTFTGYINRIRGYYGEDTARTSFYFWKPKKYQMRDFGAFPEKFTSAYAREWSIAWQDIDGGGGH